MSVDLARRTDLQSAIDRFAEGISNEHGRVEDAPDVVAFSEVVRDAAQWRLAGKITRLSFTYYLLIAHTFWAPAPMRAFHEAFRNLVENARRAIEVASDGLGLLRRCIEAEWESIARTQIEAYCFHWWRDAPGPMHAQRVLDGFRKNHHVVTAFCSSVARSTEVGDTFTSRSAYDSLVDELSRCGAGFGGYSAAQFMRKFVIASGAVVPGTSPLEMSPTLYDGVPAKLRTLVPSCYTPQQWAFVLCMRGKEKAGRENDPELERVLAGALAVTLSDADAAAKRARVVAVPRRASKHLTVAYEGRDITAVCGRKRRGRFGLEWEYEVVLGGQSEPVPLLDGESATDAERDGELVVGIIHHIWIQKKYAERTGEPWVTVRLGTGSHDAPVSHTRSVTTPATVT